MKITQEADYALRMTCLLAKETAKGNTPVGAATLAEEDLLYRSILAVLEKVDYFLAKNLALRESCLCPVPVGDRQTPPHYAFSG